MIHLADLKPEVGVERVVIRVDAVLNHVLVRSKTASHSLVAKVKHRLRTERQMGAARRIKHKTQNHRGETKKTTPSHSRTFHRWQHLLSLNLSRMHTHPSAMNVQRTAQLVTTLPQRKRQERKTKARQEKRGAQLNHNADGPHGTDTKLPLLSCPPHALT